MSAETVREVAPIIPSSIYPSVPSSAQATVVGGMSYEGYQDHRQVNAALLQQQLQQQQAAMSTQATLQLAAMQIQQQQQFGLAQPGQPAPALPAILPQPPPQQVEDQLQQQQQQHILGYAQSASMAPPVATVPVLVPSQAHRIPAAGATTVINGLPYQLQMNSDGTQVWVPIVPHSVTSYTMPTVMTFQNVGVGHQMQPSDLPLSSVSLQQQQPQQQ